MVRRCGVGCELYSQDKKHGCEGRCKEKGTPVHAGEKCLYGLASGYEPTLRELMEGARPLSKISSLAGLLDGSDII